MRVAGIGLYDVAKLQKYHIRINCIFAYAILGVDNITL